MVIAEAREGARRPAERWPPCDGRSSESSCRTWMTRAAPPAGPGARCCWRPARRRPRRLHRRRRRDRPLNVLLVMADTLRADHVGGYGYGRATTPNLDALARARRAVRERTLAGAVHLPVGQLVAHLAGDRRVSSAVRRATSASRTAVPTLAELLRRRGYATLAASASPVVRATPSDVNLTGGFGAGFDRFDESCLWREGTCVTEIGVRLLDESRDRDRQAPFFLYLHYMDPHDPYRPPPDRAAALRRRLRRRQELGGRRRSQPDRRDALPGRPGRRRDPGRPRLPARPLRRRDRLLRRASSPPCCAPWRAAACCARRWWWWSPTTASRSSRPATSSTAAASSTARSTCPGGGAARPRRTAPRRRAGGEPRRHADHPRLRRPAPARPRPRGRGTATGPEAAGRAEAARQEGAAQHRPPPRPRPCRRWPAAACVP